MLRRKVDNDSNLIVETDTMRLQLGGRASKIRLFVFDISLICGPERVQCNGSLKLAPHRVQHVQFQVITESSE